jgi:hypothetical protein
MFPIFPTEDNGAETMNDHYRNQYAFLADRAFDADKFFLF